MHRISQPPTPLKTPGPFGWQAKAPAPLGQTWGRRFRLPTPTFRTAGQQAHGNSVPYLQSGNGARSMPGIIRSAFL
jgi:hypothetical protein